MIRHAGTVVRVDGSVAWVECVRGGRCAMCPGRDACHADPLGEARSLHRLRAATRGVGLVPGASVIVGVPPGAVLRAATLAYGLPLAGLLVGAGAGTLVDQTAGLVGACLGIVAGALCASTLSRRRPEPPAVILDTFDAS